MSDFMSPFDRDLFHANRLGAKAAEFEIKQPGNSTLSDWVRDDFRKGILSRYRPSQGASEWEREKLADQRKALNVAYYAQPEVSSFDIVETVEDSSYSIPELVSA